MGVDVIIRPRQWLIMLSEIHLHPLLPGIEEKNITVTEEVTFFSITYKGRNDEKWIEFIFMQKMSVYKQPKRQRCGIALECYLFLRKGNFRRQRQILRFCLFFSSVISSMLFRFYVSYVSPTVPWHSALSPGSLTTHYAIQWTHVLLRSICSTIFRIFVMV